MAEYNKEGAMEGKTPEDSVPVDGDNLQGSIEDVQPHEHTTQRGLSTRHAQFIAMGGTIGTGLFVSSGKTLATGGPAFMVGSYVMMCMLMYMVLTAIIEMSTYLPLHGGTMSYYGTRYVSKSLGFMMGWLYFYSFAILIPFELTASALVIDYWHPNVNNAVWITVLFVVVMLLNVMPVKYYGESEFWFAGMKVLLIIGLLLLSFILFWGGGPNHHRLGFHYWTHPSAVNSQIITDDVNVGRLVAAILCALSAILPFTFTPEMIVVMAGEVQKPRVNLPKISHYFFWRLIIFYIGGAVAISVICPSDNASLTSGGHGAAASPWVVGIKNAGIHTLPGFINAVIITASWSAGNSFVYLSSRSLYALACDGGAPAIFKRCTKQGVPMYATVASLLFGLLAYMNVNTTASTVFNWFVNLTNTNGFMSWILCGVVYIRFRKACKAQGLPESALVARNNIMQPWSTYVQMFVFTLMLLLNGFNVFIHGQWDTSDFFSAYIGLPLFSAFYIIHRIYRWNDPWMIPPDQVDLHTGMAEIIELEENTVDEPPPTTWYGKALKWMFG